MHCSHLIVAELFDHSVFYSRPLPVERILNKARRALNQEGYNLVYSNCEHFATECRYGQSNSRQVRKYIT